MTIVETNPDSVIGGVDTHADVHVAAAVNHVGGMLGVESFPTTHSGYRRLVSWLASHGELTLVGVQGTSTSATTANLVNPERGSTERPSVRNTEIVCPIHAPSSAQPT